MSDRSGTVTSIHTRQRSPTLITATRPARIHGKTVALAESENGVEAIYEGTSLGCFADHHAARAAAVDHLAALARYTIAVIDTETTGLGINDEVWEVAVILRRPDLGPEHDKVTHFFVEHDQALVEALPAKYRVDHDARYDPDLALSREAAATALIDLLLGIDTPVYLLGAVPSFDERLLKKLFVHSPRAAEMTEGVPWNYHLQDIECYARGWLSAQGLHVPLNVCSDDLVALTGMATRDDQGSELYARHTALDDARWALAWYDFLTHQPPR